MSNPTEDVEELDVTELLQRMENLEKENHQIKEKIENFKSEVGTHLGELESALNELITVLEGAS